jgi:hypothetical protein
MPAENVSITQYCRVGEPIYKGPKPKSDTTFISRSLPPGTSEGSCFAESSKNYPSLFAVGEGVLTYEDDFGAHSVPFCFGGLNITQDKLGRFSECPP